MLGDLRYAIRVLVQAKGWTVVVLVSLALGIGANTALFSAINGVLLQTVPIAEPDRVVRLSWYGDNDMVRSSSEFGFGGEAPNGDRRRTTFSYPAFQRLAESNETLAHVFAGAPYGRVNLVVDGKAEIADAFIATGGYFDVIGVRAAAGRTITPDDDQATAEPVAMISHGYWQRRFGQSTDAIGKTVTINNLPCTVVGVTPAGYRGVQGTEDQAADIHLPLSLDPLLGGEERLTEATYWWLQIMGRLESGVSAAQVQGNLEGVFQAAARQGMQSYMDGLTDDERSLSHNQRGEAVPRLYVDSGRRGVYDMNPNTRREATVLAWVVASLLLIVCANVANLLLSRSTARQHEISVRLSMGATRNRLVRQLVTESVFLSLLGGVLGLIVAYWARKLLPFGTASSLDWRVFAFVAVLSVVTGVAFSLVPAFRATRIALSASLNENSRSVRGTRSLLSKGLLVLQVAVSLVLLIGAGLFLGTLRNLRSVDVGFDPSNILLFRVDPTLNGYDDEQVPPLYDRLRERLTAVAGVESVSLSATTFLSGSTWTSTVHFQDGSDEHAAHMMNVSPEFFETLRVPVLAGRVFDERDRDGAPKVAIVNATAVREFIGERQALGKRFGFSPEEQGQIEIVGVVNDVKYSEVREAAPPTIFMPYRQRSVRSMMFELRTLGEPRALVPTVRAAVREIDANVPLMEISTQAEQIEGRFRQEKFFARAYSLFGGLAILLAAIGLFGLASYNVARRTNEIGIRMALGAQRRDVVRMVLGESLTLVALGIGLGVIVTIAAGKLVASLLFGVAPTDVVTMAGAAGFLVFVTAVAGFVPALRASRVDPTVALQYE